VFSVFRRRAQDRPIVSARQWASRRQALNDALGTLSAPGDDGGWFAAFANLPFQKGLPDPRQLSEKTRDVEARFT